MSKMSSSSQPAHRIPPYRRPIIVVSFLIILVVAVAVTVIIFMSINRTQESLPEPPAAAPSPVTPVEPSEETPTLPEPEDKVTQYEGDDPNTLHELTGRIAYKAVNREPGYQTLTVSASIDQYLHAAGTCALTLKASSGAEVYSATLPAQADVTTSACGPFEIPISDFSPGTYQIEINISGDDKTGLIAEGVQL